MSRLAWRQFLLAILLLVCLGYPVAESFETWDDTLRDGNDAEANVIIVVLIVGMAVLGAIALVAAFRPPRSVALTLPARVFERHEALALVPVPNCRPPTTLRV